MLAFSIKIQNENIFFSHPLKIKIPNIKKDLFYASLLQLLKQENVPVHVRLESKTD